jgi:pilus assembly protein CpaB
MKRGQLIALGLASACGLGAMVVANSFLNKPVEKIEVEKKVDTVQVLVARSDIGLGQIANDASFRWQDWPKDAVAKGFITKQSRPQAAREFSDAIARSPIIAGEPITELKLIKAGSGGVLAAILPPGKRAVSTKIEEKSAAGRLILPNDHVDVILIRRSRGKGGVEDYNSDTIFRNIRVLAIGQQVEAKEGKKAAEGQTATLELTPTQAELLALANSMGELSLSLRSIADINSEQASAADGIFDKNKATSSSVRVLRYGAKSRQYGVN